MDAERKEQMRHEFVRRFGGEPNFWAQAPGRVDLMGSHTDYNHGYVLTLAIDRDTWIAARPRNDRVIQMQSMNLPGQANFSLDAIRPDREVIWSNYVRGVADVLQREGFFLRGFDGLVHSSIPLSSGLSSSAALEVATARLFNQFAWLGLDPVKLAVLCQRAENEFVGMNCGILDQYTSSVSTLGSALLLDCRNLTSEVVPIPKDICVVICDTHVKRALTGSEYPERRAACEQGAARLAKVFPGVTHLRDVSLEQFAAQERDLPEVVAKRCRFIIEENQRVLDLAKALPNGNREVIHRVAAASFVGARDLYEIVVPEMQSMMQAMESAPGCIGARGAGAGFGGAMIAFVESSMVVEFSASVQKNYQSITGIPASLIVV